MADPATKTISMKHTDDFSTVLAMHATCFVIVMIFVDCVPGHRNLGDMGNLAHTFQSLIPKNNFQIF